MIGGGLSLALAPAPLVVAAVLLYGLPGGARQTARLIGAVALAATLALLSLNAAVVAGGGRIEVSYGVPVTGIDLLVRADPLGMVLAMAATAMALLAGLDRPRPPLEVGAQMVCVLGAVLAGMAGNVIVLFTGIELAIVGTALSLSAGRRRPGRGAVTALGLLHAASLAVLAAAAQLQAVAGTTEFTALPQSALVTAVSAPWALGGAMLLLAPAFLPRRSPAGPCTIVAGFGAIPCGAVALLRLREAAGGSLPDPVVLMLAGIGTAVALAAALAALRWARVPEAAGRSFVLMSGAGAVAMSGFDTGSAAGAMAAGICAVILATGLAPLWEDAAGPGPSRWAGAAALAAAGGAPTGFAMVAIALEVAAAIALGRAGAALAYCLAAAGVAGALAALRAAGTHARQVWDRTEHRRIPLVSGAALAASLGAGLLPGALATGVIGALAAGSAVRSAGPAALAVPAAGWAEGYFVVPAVLAVVAVVAVARLQGWPLPAGASALAASSGRIRPTWALLLGAGRMIRRPARLAAQMLSGADAWLMVQPQLPLVLLAGVLAIVFIR
jgi:hypothetical protein